MCLPVVSLARVACMFRYAFAGDVPHAAMWFAEEQRELHSHRKRSFAVLPPGAGIKPAKGGDRIGFRRQTLLDVWESAATGGG